MSANQKCPRCNKTVYFAERTTAEGRDWHNLCLIAHQKEAGGIHNKGWYGTTPQDAAVVNAIQSEKASREPQPQSTPPPSSGGAKFCSNCGAGLKGDAPKFCSSCGNKV
eukprot:TRINITY_DN4149_c0_g1_i1.p1 TRINITY_DN4149_c0_g1~~TRINITY_DN4149_c0_g1_i1.p1  ORF type:complete len:109 (+),score=8.92 TRINITY_DN4149_c0_g1_i1:19-345(+)